MIFLDHNAGAPPHAAVRHRIRELLDDEWSNPSSPHGAGRRAKGLVEDARGKVALSVGEDPSRITFTSGATESNAAALAHWVRQAEGRRTVVCTPVEHPSVMEFLLRLEREGWALRRAPIDRSGAVPSGWIEDALDGEVAFAACMAANNETGAVLPWREWACACAGRGVPLHVDATQLWGKGAFEPSQIRGSASWSGHKVGALSGAGVLWLSDSRGFRGLAEGGPQERERRAGTESVLAVASLGEMSGHLADAATLGRWSAWREILWESVADLPGVVRTADPAASLPNTLHLRIPVRAETAVVRLDLEGVAASAGSACSSGSMRPSQVLLAMGWSASDAAQGLRLSVGHAVDEAGVREAGKILRSVLGA